MHRVLVILLSVAIVCNRGARAGELSIAAASDLVFCLEDLHRAFAKVHPDITLKATTGASGNIFAQINNGAPFDVYLSADMRYPRELIKAGLADEGSLTLYAIGHLVVWTASDEIDISEGVRSLTRGSVHKVAIANPEYAPYGRAARAALEYFNLWDVLKGKLVFGENIAQTAQFVQTGNADAGVVALSIVLAPNLKWKGRWIAVPEHAYPPLEQGAVITKAGTTNPASAAYIEFLASREFDVGCRCGVCRAGFCDDGTTNPASAAYIEFLASREARRIFDRFGFRLPE